MKIHIVQKGDTLWKIAKKYGVNFEELKKMNTQLSNPDMIMPGMKIKVPTAGGSIKKGTQYGGAPATNINSGYQKEMPKVQQQQQMKEQPIAKEQPIIKEQPKVMPKKEAPIQKPVKEAPIEEAPAPVKEAPVKEKPKKQYIPKMPKPIIPEIDINNYYMVNMAKMNVQQPPAPPPAAPKMPPPQPKKVLPVKETAKEEPIESVEEIPAQQPIQQGGCPTPMYYPQYCMPISPVLPGSGLHCPPGYPYFHHPHMHGTMSMPGAYPMPGVEGTAMMPDMGQMPQTAPTQMPYMDGDESSPFIPQMADPSAVMGAQHMPADPQCQPISPVMPGSGLHQGQMAPFGGYPAAPYGGQGGAPISPVMPGSGLHQGQMAPFGGYPAAPYGGQGGAPISPVMPGSGLHQGQMAPFGGYPAASYGGQGGAPISPVMPGTGLPQQQMPGVMNPNPGMTNANDGMMPYQMQPNAAMPTPPPFAGTDCGCGPTQTAPDMAPFPPAQVMPGVEQGGYPYPQMPMMPDQNGYAPAPQMPWSPDQNGYPYPQMPGMPDQNGYGAAPQMPPAPDQNGFAPPPSQQMPPMNGQAGVPYQQMMPANGPGQMPQFNDNGDFAPGMQPFPEGGAPYPQGTPGQMPPGPQGYRQQNDSFSQEAEGQARDGGPMIYTPPYGPQSLYVSPFSHYDYTARDESSEYEG